MKSYKLKLCVLSAVLILAGCATGKQYTVDGNIQNEKASATIYLEMKEFSIGIGGQKGHGVLTYQGVEYPFEFKGLDYGSISAVRLETTGSVYNLDKLEDFEGVYLQAKAGMAVGESGKAGIFLANKNGVTVHVSSDKEKGFDLTLGRGGIKIKFLKKEEK